MRLSLSLRGWAFVIPLIIPGASPPDSQRHLDVFSNVKFSGILGRFGAA